MNYKPTLKVGVTYMHDHGGTRLIGDESESGPWYHRYKQFRVKAGDPIWWHENGTAAISQWGDLIAPADEQSPPPAPPPAPLPKVLFEYDPATNSVRVL